jgi:AAA domain/DnaB-like helicase N terminal domain
MTTSLSNVNENSVRWGRAVLGSVLLEPEKWNDVSSLSVDDFLSGDQKKIFAAMMRLSGTHMQADVTALHNELGNGTASSLVCDLLADGTIGTNVPQYVIELRNAAAERRYHHQREVLNRAVDDETRLEAIEQLKRELLSKGSTTSFTAENNWTSIFHSWDEYVNIPPAKFAIEGFLQEDSATAIAGLPGHGKTWLMLAMVRSLLTGDPLFDYFNVTRVSKRVIYLIPESTLSPFKKRIQLFGLEEYVKSGQLLIHTLTKKLDGKLKLSDPRLLDICIGSDVFVDTIARFMDGKEDIEDARELADAIFGLLAAKASTVVTANHSPKSFEGAKYMCLENVVRGSGDIGAVLATAWGIRQIDVARNRIYIQNVKPRDFEPCEQFIIEGRPHIDNEGRFKMLELPGTAKDMASYIETKGGGRPGIPEKEKKGAKARILHAQGLSQRVIAETLDVSLGTVNAWLKEEKQ